jgi:Fe-S cluster assembly iron-binding protein IscA
MVKLEPDAARAIRSFLREKGLNRPIRIDLRSSGCCDPVLGLSVDSTRESDLIEKLDELTFVISPEIHELVGEVTISYVDDAGTKGFVLTSVKPVSEWDGVGAGDIRL